MTGPQIGQVYDGYRFKGGNPNDQGSWEPAGPIDVSSEWGSGAKRLPNGDIVREGPRGGFNVLQRGATDLNVSTNDRTPADATQRGRVNLTINPIIQSQRDSEAEEGGETVSRNPFSDDWGAAILMQQARSADDGGPIRSTVARAIGGEDFQKYDQALGTFETAFLPIFSGSAVTMSEAQRFLRANVPQPGDSLQVVERKRRNRRMLANSAASIAGAEIPYPDAPSWLPDNPRARQEEAGRLLLGNQASQPSANPQAPPRVPSPQRLRPADVQAQAPGAFDEYTRRFRAGQIDPSKPFGDRARPFIIRDERQIERLPKGAYFFLPNGSLAVKE